MPRAARMLIRVAIFAALGGFLYGYDLGLIGGALLSMREEMHFGEGVVEVIVAAAKIGAFFGTFLGGGLMLYYGRRTTIALDSVFFMLGPIIMASASGIMGLIFGRLLIGLGIGVSAVVVPAYLGELSPAKVRGRIVETYEVVLCFGMLTAVLADAALAHAPNNWRWMVGLPVVPGMILSAAMWMLPESPRWLVVDGRLDEALAVIHVMFTNDTLPQGAQESTAEVEHELLELWSSVEKDKEAVRERAMAARLARAARKARGPHAKQARKEGAEGEEWQPLQLAISQPSELIHANHSPSTSDIPDRPPGLHRTDGKAPPSPPNTEASPAADASSVFEQDGAQASEAFRDHGAARPEPPAADGHAHHAGLRSTHSMSAMPAHAHGVQVEGSSPDAAGRMLRRQLSDPSSQLYRSLSEIPTGLRPIRTTSFSEEGGSTGPHTPVARDEPHKHLRNASTLPRRRSSQLTRAGRPGYWTTQLTVLLDMWRILWGPEARAVRLALWIAVFNQIMASTAIINYAPALIQQTALSSATDATLWTGFVTGAKIVGSVISMFLVDTAGRRALMVWGSALCGLTLLAVGVADGMHSAALLVTAMCAFILAFAASYAGVFWVLLSELFSMSAKAPATAAVTATLFLAGALPDLLYLTLHSWMGPFAFVVFAGVAFSGGVYCHRHLPETKGRTLAQIQLILSKDGTAGPRGASPSLRVTAQGAGEHGVASHHGQEEMMRPVSGVHSGVAVGRSRHQQWQPADEELGTGQRWSSQWAMRQWAGYSRFTPQEA